MISFRYHVVSLVAVLLALAAGVALGSGPLQRDAAAPGTDRAETRARATAERRLAVAGQGLAFADSYARATGASLVGQTLQGRTVTLLVLPGADLSTVDDLAALVAQAGGRVTARAQLTEELLDVGNRQLVDELGTQMADQAEAATGLPAGVDGYQRLGLLLGGALTTTRDGGQPVDEAGEGILAGAETAGLFASEGRAEERGSLVLAVSGPPYGSPDDRQGAGDIVATLLAAMDDTSDGVVLTGPVEAGQREGVVAALRADPSAAEAVSSVDVADRAAGEVVTVLALAEQAAGRSGHYGTAAAPDGALPSGRRAG